ncbi:UDP-N-acetylglucosamine 2-epimerase (non-hydrolyzing) [Enterococcus faecalis]|nr:UDP-N-acetylglucosamine 2-epimerase (non-hydrolyzing) [Enterococcus faecalis]
MKKIKVISIFGTRPEAIKMVPLIKELEKDKRFVSKVLVTAQHREMLDQVLKIFNIIPDYDLDVMKKEQTLEFVTSRILEGIASILEVEKPDIVLVHGDTVTSFAGSLAAFYKKVKIGHVEAGLRTYNKWAPFPEEVNRQFTDYLSDIYFTPTEEAKRNLEKENTQLRSSKHIYVTGNTAIDAMNYTIKKEYMNKNVSNMDLGREKVVLITMHRRENLGNSLNQVFNGIRRAALQFPSVKFVFPMHKNPLVRKAAETVLGEGENIVLLDALDVSDFHNVLARSYCVLTDSGGIQEEAPSLGVPVFILRESTERTEGIKLGTAKLVGTNEENVFNEIISLLKDRKLHKKMSKVVNLYGDGKASKRIVDAILYEFGMTDYVPEDFSLKHE